MEYPKIEFLKRCNSSDVGNYQIKYFIPEINRLYFVWRRFGCFDKYFTTEFYKNIIM